MSDPYSPEPRTGGRAPGHASGLGGSHPPSWPVQLDKDADTSTRTDIAEGGESGSTGKKVAKLFDLRLLIGGLFTVYGIVLIIAGLADGKKELAKASGIRINLWTGLGMLVVGLLFLLWARLTDDGHKR